MQPLQNLLPQQLRTMETVWYGPAEKGSMQIAQRLGSSFVEVIPFREMGNPLLLSVVFVWNLDGICAIIIGVLPILLLATDLGYGPDAIANALQITTEGKRVR